MARKLQKEEYEKIKKTIIKKLYAHNAYSKGHLLFETLKSGLPSHLLGFVKYVLDDLLKEGIVIYYGKTAHGDAYQLNIKRLQEINEIVFGV